MSRVPIVSRIPRSFAVSLTAGALYLFGALPATAQDVNPLLKLDPGTRFTVDLLMDSAAREGLPFQSLRSKALLGIARKADGKKIVAEVRKQFANLRAAHEALGGVQADELEAAAAVLEAGAKPAQLVAFRVRQQGRSSLEAFTTWADFLGRNIPRDEASSAITKLWQDGADDATFKSLWNNVQADILQGLNPGMALQNRIRESPRVAPTTTGKPTDGTQENQSSR